MRARLARFIDPHNRGSLQRRFAEVRHFSECLAAPLSAEDCQIQAMPDVSPVKWHLAHTTWFFEEFVLRPLVPDAATSPPEFALLFNSYYEGVGPFWPRHRRGLISRPTLADVLSYRHRVTEAVADLLDGDAQRWPESALQRLELGINHEEQHQELMLTDIKYNLAQGPTAAAYASTAAAPDDTRAAQFVWIDVGGGASYVGHGGDDFAYDNEGPRHRVDLAPFRLANRLTTNGEFLAFMEDGGYEEPQWWLSDGWAMVQSAGWRAPLYWEQHGDQWWTRWLGGLQPVHLADPVSHVSYYEAQAYAAWAGCRLPTEHEWEVASATADPDDGRFLDLRVLRPLPALSLGRAAAPASVSSQGLMQMFGDVWEWTGSAYLPYPGFKTAAGALGEYNGKFMCNQMVLRGGSCVTPLGHVRRTYRNFFVPSARWQFSGVRLASDA